MEGFSQNLIDMLQQCNDAASQTGDEGPGETIPTVDASIQSTCDAISDLQAFLLNEQINALAVMDINLLSQVANYLEQGGVYEFGLVIAMINSNTNLGFKEFKKLYELVVNELQPAYSLNSEDVDALLQSVNSQAVTTLENFMSSNPNGINDIHDIFVNIDDEPPHSWEEWVFLTTNANKLYTLQSNSNKAFSRSTVIFSSVCGTTTGGGAHNGPIDAIRHAIFTALNVKSFGASFAQEFGDTHENYASNPVNEKAMDLANNEVGIQIMAANSTATETDIENAVKNAFDVNGSLLMIENGNLVTASCP